MAAVEKKIFSRESTCDGSKWLKLVEMSVFEWKAQVLFDPGAVENVMAASRCFQLHLQLHSRKIRTRIEDGSGAKVLWEVDIVPTTVGGTAHTRPVLVVNDALLGY